MKKVVLVIIGVCVLVGLAYAAAELSETKTYSFKYKLIISIDTPEGVKKGFSVREVNMKFEPRLAYRPHPYHSTIDVDGEAVAIDLGHRGLVFATIPSGAYVDVTKTIEGPPIGTIEGAEFYSSLKNIQAEMSPENYPWFYTFTDVNDPKTVRLVKGGRFSVEEQRHLMEDNFKALFGEGVKLQSVRLEITDEPVTWGIEKWLPWLSSVGGGYLDGASGNYKNELSNILHGGHFQRGEKK